MNLEPVFSTPIDSRLLGLFLSKNLKIGSTYSFTLDDNFIKSISFQLNKNFYFITQLH